jgi:tetratricopeptide (TPR) repeat protein
VSGDDDVPAEAVEAHEQGRRLGAKGKYKKALAEFARAAELAPDWPYPPYDSAFTHLLMNDHAAALAAYEEVDRLAPRGFFTSKTAVWALQQEALGRFPRGTYREYLSIEWESSPKKAAVIAKKLVDKHPEYAPAYMRLANLTGDPQERLRLLDAGLAAEPDVETLGMLRLNRSDALRALGRAEEADDELTTLLATPGITVSAEAWARQLQEVE